MRTDHPVPIAIAHRWAEEEERGFVEVLAVSLEKAPYLLVSLAIHGVAVLLLTGLAILRPEERPEVVILVQNQAPPSELVELTEPPELGHTPIQIPEPRLQEVDFVADRSADFSTEAAADEPDFAGDSALDQLAWSEDIGLGGSGGGLRGQRGEGGGRARLAGESTEKSVLAALHWLREHQAPEGYWDCDEFMVYDQHPEMAPSTGAGSPVNDVGVTALALLAFLGHGDSLTSGRNREAVQRGIAWLKSVQLADGLFGSEVGNPTLYNHALATMAVGEAYYFGHSPILKAPLLRAVGAIERARNETGVWRYGLRPNGDNDSSITGWMVFALETARDTGIPVDAEAFAASERWYDGMTDASGRTGYTVASGAGSRPSRKAAWLERFPPERSESLTAVSLLCRIFMADTTAVRRWQDHPKYPLLRKQAELIAATPPVWDPEGGSCDFYYWYYATYALHQWGGEPWRVWRQAIEDTLLRHQHLENKSDNLYGSWDPVGPWGADGGRVYATAIGTLILEVYYRYGKVLGGR